MNIIDTHVHSSFSFDADNTPREMIERALELGVSSMTFTDHIDIAHYYGSFSKQSELMPRGAKEILSLRDEYKDRINIGFGAEISGFMHVPELSRKLIREFNFDYIIGAVHEVRNYEDFYYLNYNEINPNEILRLYFDEMLEMVQFADIDCIAHLTYPLRYITGDYKIQVDLNEYTDIIQEIFKTAAGRDLALEINTSGLRKAGFECLFPALEHVSLFKECGGSIITIGSDAHKTADIAANFKQATEVAEAAGFKQIAYFEKRKPIFVSI
ncbi:MAG: histidinol-phosphatase HisJ family protein [Oscillospiraceae bacterium]|nr:histidinol-phosphatase HisJ family protein [Oscillospiraceae bacterium]